RAGKPRPAVKRAVCYRLDEGGPGARGGVAIPRGGPRSHTGETGPGQVLLLPGPGCKQCAALHAASVRPPSPPWLSCPLPGTPSSSEIGWVGSLLWSPRLATNMYSTLWVPAGTVLSTSVLAPVSPSTVNSVFPFSRRRTWV